MQRKVGRKWKQSDLAAAVDLSPQQISRYEKETDEPKWGMWKKMAKALLIADPGELAFGPHAPPAEPTGGNGGDVRKEG